MPGFFPYRYSDVQMNLFVANVVAQVFQKFCFQFLVLEFHSHLPRKVARLKEKMIIIVCCGSIFLEHYYYQTALFSPLADFPTIIDWTRPAKKMLPNKQKRICHRQNLVFLSSFQIITPSQLHYKVSPNVLSKRLFFFNKKCQKCF